MIQATAKKHLIPKIKAEVQEGSAYEVENVLVIGNDPKYATIKHKFRLNLIDRTTFTKLDESNIPINHYISCRLRISCWQTERVNTLVNFYFILCFSWTNLNSLLY